MLSCATTTHIALLYPSDHVKRLGVWLSLGWALGLYLYQANLWLWLGWSITAVFAYCSIKLPVPRYLVIRANQIWIDQHCYTIDPRSRVGLGFCWLCLCANNRRRSLLVFADMLDKISYRRLCFSLLRA
ncbi:hypothetical protein EV690_2841 [Celerinatantimonas diazotrophica]|uniref:Toxin CptA n=1 Tax=Celerinatantimonas diazotrophica TaxID=412034 RepID=A0A4R1J969_9GAMM|nr:hypothetical protein EV690_2841 [Celerinatantimonas diazotrophica]CAG9295914.1 hypothetical protein CEDIAZO_01048 [Celerinatantimonas diazotrophica]